MKAVKVSEATGPVLDWMVCRAQNPDAAMSSTHVWLNTGDGEDDFLIEETSTDWSQGGPIIEREGIELRHIATFNEWAGVMQVGVRQTGPTPLIAAMRCYVVSKLGDYVEIPEELE